MLTNVKEVLTNFKTYEIKNVNMERYLFLKHLKTKGKTFQFVNDNMFCIRSKMFDFLTKKMSF